MKLLCSNIILGSDRPVRLHGGLVLGVTFDKKIRSGESLTLMMPAPIQQPHMGGVAFSI